VGPCNYGFARPRVADGGDSHIWKVVANILNKQSRSTEKGLTSSFAVGRGLTTSHRKPEASYDTLQTASRSDVFFGTN
jgi:hypothetical protein